MGSLDGRPTRVRLGVMGYLCTLAYILYIDRICIGQAGTVMKAELGLTNSQWGLVGVAFQLAYAVFEPTTGHWGDRYGSRARPDAHCPVVVGLHGADRLRLEVLRRACPRHRHQRLPPAAADPLPVRGG